MLLSRLNLAAGLALALAGAAFAGPQHWGFGMSYLASLERGSDNTTRLVVYEAPLRAKDAPWISRWIDDNPVFNNAQFLAAGNFWPGQIGKEHLVVITRDENGYQMRVLDPPEVFGTQTWPTLSTRQLSSGNIVGAAAGDVLQRGSDQLLLAVMTKQGLDVLVLAAPVNRTSGAWGLLRRLRVPMRGNLVGFAAGDFWNENRDHLAFAFNQGGSTRLFYYRVNNTVMQIVTSETTPSLPVAAQNGLTAGDYVKDDFDVLTFVPANAHGSLELRVAPGKTANAPIDPGPHYTGRALSRQWLPGSGGAESRVTMTGTRLGMPSGTRSVAMAAGRLFGYVVPVLSTAVRNANSIVTTPDAEIAFTRRFPLLNIVQGAPHYGWPTKGQTFGYEINLKNNGTTTIPAGAARFRVWINSPFRNADTHPATRNNPDFTVTLNEPLLPYDPMNPTYPKFSVTSTWLYDLIPVGPGATWKKINLDAVGERWLVVSMECDGDTNPRNNRYEAAIHALTLHPIFRNNNSLADRRPTVAGDPPSKHYLTRKLADAVTCMYERSGTTDNEDVLQRVYFDSYEFGWPDDLPEPQRSQKWALVQSTYEGWRALDQWWGENQDWERFNWPDGGAELHETGHLFHPLGDLYQYTIHPVWTGFVKYADGTPVQIASFAWGHDSYSTGYAMMGYPAMEQVRRVIVGSRGGGVQGWWELAPDRIFVRVLDRNGNPVPGAQVKLYPYAGTSLLASGATLADGRFNIGYPGNRVPTVDRLGRKHYQRWADEMSFIVTVAIGENYQEARIWGQEDQNAHGRHTWYYQSWINPTEYTYDIQTNYLPGAPAPDFTVEGAVEGRRVRIGINGPANATYRLYRRWEPSYVRQFIGTVTAAGTTVTTLQDMAVADSYRANRSRAIYEITRVVGEGESLPAVIQPIGLANAWGISQDFGDTLLVASNTGIANPYGIQMKGVTPYRELFYHFRFGHTAHKFVRSQVTTGKYYATLAFSDMDPDFRFEIIDPPGQGQVGYDVRNEVRGFWRAGSYSTTAPFTFTSQNVSDAAKIIPGDIVRGNAGESVVLAVNGAQITTQSAIFSAGQSQPEFWVNRTAGRPGSNATLRETQNARGLGVIRNGAPEFVVVADTGNSRVAVWDANTRYITHWEQVGVRPAAIAAHPTASNKFFMLNRQSNRASQLYLFTFNGTSLSVDSGYPVAVSTGDATGTVEMGLAAAVDPATNSVVLAITDATMKAVYELGWVGGSLTQLNTFTVPIGTFAGNATLDQPTDVVYQVQNGQLRLFAADGADRVVQLK